MAKREPTATLKLNAWELVAIEEALRVNRRYGLPHCEPISKAALLKKITEAQPK